MRIEQLVDEQTKRELNYTKQSNRKKEKLSQRDLAELMDTNKRGFKRHRGVWRSK